MPTQQASVIVRTVVVTPVEGDPLLMVQLDIDCPLCGVTQGTLMGHHLKTLVQRLSAIVAEHPALCGDLGEVVDVTEFAGAVDPDKSRYN